MDILMIIQKLEDGWKLRNCSSGECFNAKVPGTVYGTWLEYGAMEDPYWRDCEDKALAMMEAEYEYSLTVTLEKEVGECDVVWLLFEGIDTLADIWLNGHYLGHADNMHRAWQYPVKPLVKAENIIRVLLSSPLPFIRKAYEEDPYDGAPESMKGFPFLRKAHCSFGWDWGPRLPDAGLFRNVAFIGAKKAAILDVHISQSHREEGVVLSLYPEVKTFCSEEVYSCEVRIMDPEGTLTVYLDTPKTVTIPQPKLWWPNGYGDQPLYLVELVLKAGDER
ncbi:MAG TPA: glycoside hydrolase family 2, partial [Lachnoclostridium sp.]|nr:glycoside hydrolase family 2 [Lachnoclostridium sp.]